MWSPICLRDNRWHLRNNAYMMCVAAKLWRTHRAGKRNQKISMTIFHASVRQQQLADRRPMMTPLRRLLHRPGSSLVGQPYKTMRKKNTIKTERKMNIRPNVNRKSTVLYCDGYVSWCAQRRNKGARGRYEWREGWCILTYVRGTSRCMMSSNFASYVS